MTTLFLATAALVLVAAGVAWACVRLAREVARYDEWDQTPAKVKRESWK
jgi:hypothetical protein